MWTPEHRRVANRKRLRYREQYCSLIAGLTLMQTCGNGHAMIVVRSKPGRARNLSDHAL